MDWLVPQDTGLSLGGGGYDSLYKPYSVEPLVSRFSYNGSSGLGGGSTSNSLGAARRPTINRAARTVALDDIDELTLAVETKNFLGSKAVVMPSAYNTAATSIYAANPSGQMSSGGGNVGYDANQALFTSIYDDSGNNVYQNFSGNSAYEDPIYNPSQFQPTNGSMRGGSFNSFNGSQMLQQQQQPQQLSPSRQAQPSSDYAFRPIQPAQPSSQQPINPHEYLASPTNMFLTNPMFNKNMSQASLNSNQTRQRNNASSNADDPYSALKYQPQKSNNAAFAASEPHNNQQQRLIQYQQRMLQEQQKQQQQYQQYQPYQNQFNGFNNQYNSNLMNDGQQQQQNFDFDPAKGGNGNTQMENDWNLIFNQNQLKKKHYSEMSIPTTSADPLNSENPTPNVLSPNNRNNNMPGLKNGNKTKIPSFSNNHINKNNNNNGFMNNNNNNNINNNNSNRNGNNNNHHSQNLKNNNLSNGGGFGMPGISSFDSTTDNGFNNKPPAKQAATKTRRNGNSNEYPDEDYINAQPQPAPSNAGRQSKRLDFGDNGDYQFNGFKNQNGTNGMASKISNKLKSKSMGNSVNNGHHNSHGDYYNMEDEAMVEEDPYYEGSDYFAAAKIDKSSVNGNVRNSNNINNHNGNAKVKRNATLNGKKDYNDDSINYYNSYGAAPMRPNIKDRSIARDKYTPNDYRTFAKDGGFGRNFETETKDEKLEKKRQRDEYARQVKERNSSLASSNMSSNNRLSNNSSSDAYSVTNSNTGNGVNKRGSIQSQGLHSYSRYTDKASQGNKRI